MNSRDSGFTDDLRRRLSAVASHHVPNLPWRQVQVLTLQAIGFHDEDIAATLGVSVTTVQELAYAARRAVVPPGYADRAGAVQPLAADRRNATAWAWLNRSCCTATAFSAIEMVPSVAGRLRTLAKLRIPPLDGEESFVLMMRTCGYGDDEIASRMHVSGVTVKRRLRALREKVSLHGGQVTDSEVSACAWLHAECCGTLPAEILEMRQTSPIAPPHAVAPGPRTTSIAAFVRRARLAPVVAFLWLGASMGALIGRKRQQDAGPDVTSSVLYDDGSPQWVNRE